MFTEQQQHIIDSLMAEFNRINSSKDSSRSYSLVDLDSLLHKTNEIREYETLSKKDNEHWKELAKNEALNIVQQLRKDLPDAKVELCDGRNEIRIVHKSLSINVHHEERVDITVLVSQRYVDDSYGNRYSFGKSLCYEVYPCTTRGLKYDTINEAVKDERFLEGIRRRVLLNTTR